MRISTALVSALVAGGTLSLSLQYANSQQQASPTLDLTGADQILPRDTTSSSSEVAPPTQEPSGDAVEATASPSATQTSTEPQATSDATSNPSQSAGDSQSAPALTQAPANEPAAAPAPKELTVTSDVIEYKFGVVQISLTAVGSDITNVTLLQGDTSYGRDVAYVALIDATVKTDGINYGNVSGATFTTEAFKKAVTNAIAKL